MSILVVAVGSHWLLSLAWRNALLLGAVLAPTDAAAVFSVLRKLPLPPRLSGMLEPESGLNDAPAALAVTLLSGTGLHPSAPALVAGIVGYQLAAGAAIGLLAGLLGALSLRRVALPASGLYPIAVLALIVASYGAASLAGASGFLAVYLAALVLGNVAAASTGHPRLRGGNRLARPDRAVRHARAARLPGAAARSGPAGPGGRVCARAYRPARRGDGLHLAVAGCGGVSRHSCPGPGCAGQCRSFWRRFR